MPPSRTFSDLVKGVPGLQRDRERLITEACRAAAKADPVIRNIVDDVKTWTNGLGEAGALRLVAAIGVWMDSRQEHSGMTRQQK